MQRPIYTVNSRCQPKLPYPPAHTDPNFPILPQPVLLLLSDYDLLTDINIAVLYTYRTGQHTILAQIQHIPLVPIVQTRSCRTRPTNSTVCLDTLFYMCSTNTYSRRSLRQRLQQGDRLPSTRKQLRTPTCRTEQAHARPDQDRRRDGAEKQQETRARGHDTSWPAAETCGQKSYAKVVWNC